MKSTWQVLTEYKSLGEWRHTVTDWTGWIAGVATLSRSSPKFWYGVFLAISVWNMTMARVRSFSERRTWASVLIWGSKCFFLNSKRVNESLWWQEKIETSCANIATQRTKDKARTFTATDFARAIVWCGVIGMSLSYGLHERNCLIKLRKRRKIYLKFLPCVMALFSHTKYKYTYILLRELKQSQYIYKIHSIHFFPALHSKIRPICQIALKPYSSYKFSPSHERGFLPLYWLIKDVVIQFKPSPN